MIRWLRYVTGMIVLAMVSCQPVDIMDDLVISLDTNIIKTFLSFRFFDSSTGNMIGSAGNQTVKLSFSGPDAEAVVSQVGEKVSQIESVGGIISLGLNPYEPYRLGEGNTVDLTVSVDANGYTSALIHLTITRTGVNTILVPLVPTQLPAGPAEKIIVKTGEVQEGFLQTGFRVVSPSSLFEIELPDSIKLQNTEGAAAEGRLTLDAKFYDDLSQAPVYSGMVMKFDRNGMLRPGVVNSLAALDLILDAQTTGKVTRMPEKGIMWRFRISEDLVSGETVPIWSYDEDYHYWKYEGEASLKRTEDGISAEAELHHLSFYIAGQVYDSQRISGNLSFSFQKPFTETGFDGRIVVREAISLGIVQQIPVRFFSGLQLPVEIDVPAGAEVRLSAVADHSDFEFSCDPGYLTVPAGAASFNGTFSLRPMKCPFQGVLSVSVTSGFNNFPLPARLKISDAFSGSTYANIACTINGAQSSIPVNAMLPEEKVIRLSLEPVSLVGDFNTTPAAVEIASSCSQSGSWSMHVHPNIPCTASATLRFELNQPAPADPVPVDVLFLRKSDQMLIERVAVSVSNTSMTKSFSVFVPLHTPLTVKVIQQSSRLPLHTDPVSISWNDPCNQALNNVVNITTDYAQLSSRINFDIDQNLLASSIPLAVRLYRASDDLELDMSQYQVTRSQPYADLDFIAPLEEIYMKISRADASVRFNPIPYKIEINDPRNTPAQWQVKLWPTQLLPVHFLVRVVCPGGEILPTVQGYYRIPGDEWKELYIVNGHLNLNLEIGLTYEVGMFLGGAMIDSSFTVTQQEYDMVFPLDPRDCERMGWK